MLLRREPFGVMPDETAVELFELTNGRLTASIAPYGGVITRLLAPDRDGRAETIVLGYPTLSDYVQHSSYVGALIGRYANRLPGRSACLLRITWQPTMGYHLPGETADSTVGVWTRYNRAPMTGWYHASRQRTAKPIRTLQATAHIR